MKYYISCIALLITNITFAATNHFSCLHKSIGELNAAYQNKKILPSECIQQIALAAKSHKQDNIFTQIHFNDALKQALQSDERWKNQVSLGPLDGIPFVVKDNIDVNHYATTAGTPALLHNNAAADATVVKNLKQHGAIVFGKTNMHELAMGVTSHNYYFGPVRNPKDPTRFAGGSSGGSATAVAFGLVPFALGTDTAGSVRIPAALSGVVGFRPSASRYSREGVVPVAKTLDTVGILANTVADVVIVDAALLNKTITQSPMNPEKKIRLGQPNTFYQDLDPAVQLAIAKTQKKLTDMNIQLIPFEVPLEFAKLIAKTATPIAFFEMTIEVKAYLANRVKGLTFIELVHQIKSPDVKQGMLAIVNKPVSKKDYLIAKNNYRKKIQEMVQQFLVQNQLDALIFPTTILPAHSIKGTEMQVMHNGRNVNTVDIYTKNTIPGANADLPGISIPMMTHGMPVGIELDGAPLSDDKLLQIALRIQNHLKK